MVEKKASENNSRWLTRREHELCVKLEEERWKAHDKLHATDTVVRQKTDEELNDVRQRFISRDVYEAQRQADQRLMMGLLGLVVVSFSTAIGALVALAT